MAEKQCNLIKNGGGGKINISTTINKSTAVSAGTNTDITLDTAFNNPHFVSVALYTGSTWLVSQTLSFDDFKTKNIRMSYWDSASYFTDISYVSNTKIHVKVNSMPAGATLAVRVTSYTLSLS